MTDAIPLGQREGPELEFKERGALSGDLEGIVRAVVSLLNTAAGGAVWVGLAEQDGYATRVEGIPAAEREKDRLLDVLVDTVEPRPTQEEVAVDVVHDEAGAAVLRIRCMPGEERGPYARVGRQGARTFVRRVGARNVPMAREELARAFAAATRGRDRGEAERQKAAALLLAERDREIEAGTSGLLLLLRPAPPAELALGRPELRRLLTEATHDARVIGFDLANPYVEPRPGSDSLETTQGAELSFCFRRDGSVRLRVGVARLETQEAGRGSPGLSGRALASFPTVAARLAARAYELNNVPKTAALLADLALLNLPSRALDRRSLSGWPDWLPATVGAGEEGHVLLPDPIPFAVEELVQRPDGCAKQLVRRLLFAFGVSDDRLPPWWTADDRFAPPA